jgi:CRISPR-associated protein Cas1
MKKHLNTLFVTTQGAYLNKEGETVVVSVDREKKLQIPVHTLDGIVCFGRVMCSPYLMGFCADKDVAISFLTEHGRFLARVQGPVSGNVLLRREQYRRADDQEASAKIAQDVLMGKLANSRTVIQRVLRDHGGKVDESRLSDASQHISALLKSLRAEMSLDSLRGIEGDAARVYFGVFDQFIVNKDNGFAFKGRNRRPPLDPVNCLLSFVYTLLLHDVRSALEAVGLDSAVGYLHRDRPGRPGLALDMMEEFRSVIADRMVLSLINRGQATKKAFVRQETGAVIMKDDFRKTVLVNYQKRKQNEIIHPFLEEKISIGLLFTTQALLLARYLRGDLDAYPPLVWR